MPIQYTTGEVLSAWEYTYFFRSLHATTLFHLYPGDRKTQSIAATELSSAKPTLRYPPHKMVKDFICIVNPCAQSTLFVFPRSSYTVSID